MHIRTIHLENFRKFTDPMRVANLGDGVTIIAGDNEDGKSTILRALKAAFHTKHNSDAAAREMQTYGSSLPPKVSVEFDLDGNRYVMTKAFGKKGTADFKAPGGHFKGSEAEEKLYELCGLGGEKDKKERSIFNVLWVEQGTAFSSPDVQDIGKRSLESALEGELGKIVGGSEGQLLLKRVKALYDKWFTGTGKDKKGADASEFIEAQQQFLEIEASYQTYLAQFTDQEETLKRFDDIREQLNSHEQQQTLQKARQAVADLQSKAAGFNTKREELKTLAQTKQAKTVLFEAAQKDFNARKAAISSLEQQATKLNNLGNSIEKLNEAIKPCADLLAKLATNRDNAEQAAAEADKAVAQADMTFEVAERQQQKNELNKSQIKAKQAAEQNNALRKEIEEITIDSKTIQQLRALKSDMDVKQAQLRAASIKIEFHPTAGKGVSRNGEQLPAAQPIDVVETTSFELEGWGAVKVVPGAGQLTTLAAAAEKSASAWAAALQAANASSLESAEELFQLKTEKLQKWSELKSEVTRWAPDGIPALTTKMEAIDRELSELFEKEPSLANSLIAADAAKQQRQAARVTLDTARKHLAEMTAKCNQAKLQLEKQTSDLQEMQTQEKVLREQITKQEQDLTAQRASMNDEQINQNLAITKTENDAAEKAYSSAEAELAATNANAIEAEIESAKKNAQRTEEMLSQLEAEKNKLAGGLQNAGSTGLQEELKKHEGKLELAREEMQRAEKKAKAIKLLYDTLMEAEKNSKDELVLPLIKHLEPYVSDVFSDGKLILNKENFSITQISRSAYTEEFGQLSLGTKEQLSILTRLAFAQVLKDNGCPAVLILDDALVYSDNKRFTKMQEVLLKAAEKFQVLIFTCHEHNYRDMGAPLMKISDCAPIGSAQR